MLVSDILNFIENQNYLNTFDVEFKNHIGNIMKIFE